jgi:hypothetical protein
MSFFEPDPALDATADGDEDSRDPRTEPPFDELPALAPVGVVLAATHHVAIALVGARVFSDGVEFAIERRLRRADMSRGDFRRLAHDDRFLPDDEARSARLRYGMLLADGQRLQGRYPRGGDGSGSAGVLSGHVLVQTGGSGGGSDSRYEHHDGLWLHPLPPAGPIELVVQWPAVGISETRTVIDGTRILLAAADVRPLWPR